MIDKRLWLALAVLSAVLSSSLPIVVAQTSWPANTTFGLAADVTPKMWCLVNNVWQACASGGTLDTTSVILEEDGAQKASQPWTSSPVTFRPYPAGLPAGVTHTYRIGAAGPGGMAYSLPMAIATPGAQPPPPPPSGTNLAIGKTASANDTAAPLATYAPGNAVDGSLTSYWAPNCCGSGVNWWQVDLAASLSIVQVKPLWIAPRFPRSYQIQVSVDGTTWTVPSGASTTTGDGGQDDFTFAAVTARYVRLNLLAYGGGEAGYYLANVEIYGASSAPAPLTYTGCTPPQNTTTTTNQAVPYTMPLGTTSGGTAPITQTQSPLGPYAVGTTAITMTATDVAGQTATCPSSITVTYQPPALSLACVLLVSAISPDGNPVAVTIPDAAVTGGVSPIVQTKAPPSGSLFPVGASTDQITAVDAVGQKASCVTGVSVSYTPPPPPPPVWTASMTADVGQCYLNVTTSGPPPGTTGYSGRARRHAPNSTSYTNIGSATSSSMVYPYTVKSGLVGAGTYVTEWVWTKSGATTQIQPAGQKICGGALP